MSTRVQVERIHARSPQRAALAAVSSTFALIAPRRDLLVASVAWDDAPGLAVAPWTLAGIDTAAREQGLTLRHVALEACGAAPGRRAAAEDGPRTAVELPGMRRARRVPRSWFGAHLCLVVPCAHARNGTGWIGPAVHALRALDRACGGDPQATVGAGLASSVFASTTLVVDGSWWAPLTDTTRLIPLDRCVVLGSTAPSPRWQQQVLDGLDPWIAAQLQLGRTPSGPAAIEASGSAARSPWPRLPHRLAAEPRIVDGLWDDPRRAKRRTFPRVPGELGRLWHAFGAGAR